MAPSTSSTLTPASSRRHRPGAWVGGLELATEPVDETSTRMTAQVIHDVGADIQAVVEAEDRPSLDRFNTDLLADRRIGAQSQGS